jgi:hypothetical protein
MAVVHKHKAKTREILCGTENAKFSNERWDRGKEITCKRCLKLKRK